MLNKNFFDIQRSFQYMFQVLENVKVEKEEYFGFGKSIHQKAGRVIFASIFIA